MAKLGKSGPIDIADVDGDISAALSKKVPSAGVAGGRAEEQPSKIGVGAVKYIPFEALKCAVGDRADDVGELSKSIKKQGLIVPIVVNKKFKVLDGRRRWQALSLMKTTDRVPVVVVADDKDQLLIEITTNQFREDLTPLQRARVYRKWLKKTGKTMTDLARELGCSATAVSDVMSVFDAPKPEEIETIAEAKEAAKVERAAKRAPSERRGRPTEIVDLDMEFLPEGIRAVRIRKDSTEITVRLEYDGTAKKCIDVDDTIRLFSGAIESLATEIESAINGLIVSSEE
jgi:ParB/RepB/Spo0J family partition protein